MNKEIEEIDKVIEIVTSNNPKKILGYINKLELELKQTQELALEHQKINGELKGENARLNNIINKLEKYLNEQIQKSWEIEEQCYQDIESKLQELKGSEKMKNLLNILKGEE